MSNAENQTEIAIDASNLNPKQLSERLDGIPADSVIRVTGLAEGLNGLFPGINESIELCLDNAVGSLAFMASRDAKIEVAGNAANSCGHSLQSGSILIRGDARNFLAAYAQGGYIAVHGRAGDFVGYGLSGADILVRSRCGSGVGANMTAGTIVLGNGCGENLGQGMTGGVIYVRGEVGSIAGDVQAGRLKEADTIRLGLMLVRAGIKTGCEKFQVFRPKSDKVVQR